MSNTDITKNRGERTRVLANGKQFLSLIRICKAYLARHLVQFEENLLIFHGKIRNNLSFVSCENIIDQLQGKHSSLA